MDRLSLFGLLAVTLMLLLYALENRSPWLILAFAGACALAPSTASRRSMALWGGGGDLGWCGRLEMVVREKCPGCLKLLRDRSEQWGLDGPPHATIIEEFAVEGYSHVEANRPRCRVIRLRPIDGLPRIGGTYA